MSDVRSTAGDVPRILFVCTANRCRSPMAEAICRSLAAAHDAAVDVSSAGILRAGLPATDEAVAAVAEMGGDATTHHSTRLAPDIINAADLIVGMAREHVREVVALVPDAWPRTYTLKEIVRRGSRAGARSAEESVRAWARRIGTGRTHVELMGASTTDDIADPIGRPMGEYRVTAARIDDGVRTMLRLLGYAVPMSAAGEFAPSGRSRRRRRR